MPEDVIAQLVAQGAVIERLVSDSRRAGPGAAFFAWPGEAGDGRRHIADALARGTAAVVWESREFDGGPLTVPNAGIAGLRSRAGEIASQFHGRPSEALWVCGVTGTNGKTSCTQWLASLLTRAGSRTAVIGTLGSGFPDALTPASRTTPDVLDLHRELARLRAAGATAVAIEVSSHALVQGRVDAVAFDCALFTNLSHDHLDYHRTMEQYARAKARLFDAEGLARSVVNLDDPVGLALAERLAARGQHTIGYRTSDKTRAPRGLARLVDGRVQRTNDTGVELIIEADGGQQPVAVPVLGQFNVENALGVLGCLLAHGESFSRACARLADIPPVPGRMQRVEGEGRPLVVIDYAHTPDALGKVLAALRPIAQSRGGSLVVVFGAGGDRDPTKRAPMGEAARRGADRVVLTSDNPRSEDPDAILDAIARGAGGGDAVLREADRARAIDRAIDEANDADVILIAGKGHEGGQEAGGRVRPFSDVDEACAALARRAERR